MGGSVVILYGKREAVLDNDVLEHIIEVRVEQELSKPTRFAIRFSEDFCKDTLEISSVAELRVDTEISILVRENPDSANYHCLVKGPITEVKTSLVTGGQGSWYECKGEDVRQHLDRTEYERRWAGRVSDIVAALVKQSGYTIENPPQTRINYDGETGNKKTLSQSGTNLKFITDQARKNSYDFWVTYKVKMRPVINIPYGPVFSVPNGVAPTFHFKPSPDADASVGSELSLGQLTALFPPTLQVSDGQPALIVNTADDPCSINTYKFSLDVDTARLRSMHISSLDDKSRRIMAEEQLTPVKPMKKKTGASDKKEDEVPPVTAENFTETSQPRTATVASTATPEEQRLEALARLYKDSWFVSATCSTSTYRYGQPIVPHEVIEVRGIGPYHSGPFQVSKVTHVVTPEHHLMDLTLRRNTMGVPKAPGPDVPDTAALPFQLMGVGL